MGRRPQCQRAPPPVSRGAPRRLPERRQRDARGRLRRLGERWFDGEGHAVPPRGAPPAAREVLLRSVARGGAGSVPRVLIRVGHSADPDDAFMVWALDAGRVDTRGLEFERVVSDIQTLNEWACEGRLEVSAISLGAYPHVAHRYVLLPHGASMGSGYGPIVVAREPLDRDDLRGS